MIRYASRTGGAVILSDLRAHGWRLMVSARGRLRHEGFRYALDNGAWTASEERRKGLRATADLDLRAFKVAVDRMGAEADFIVVPDVVADAARSWPLTRYWLRRLRRDRRLRRAVLMIAVQDGMEPEAIRPFLSRRVGVFVGGSTEWKLSTMTAWGRLAADQGAWCHVGRVNTGRRARLCEIAGVRSFDGSGPSRYSQERRRIDEALVQPDLEGWINRLPRTP